MKLISYEDIIKLNISPLECYKWVLDAITNKDSAYLPAKTSIKPDHKGVFYTSMPCLIPDLNAAGVKLVTRYPERVPSLDSQILLYDYRDGQNIALLDGNWITAMRTGAVAAHSIKEFAVKDFNLLGCIGLGNTARASLLVLLALYPDRELTIKLFKYKKQHEDFAERFKAYTNVKFIYCDTIEEVIDQSDVVVSAATYFDNDICEDKYYKEGVLLVPIHTCGFKNCDLFFDKVFADDTGHVEKFKYFDKFRSFAEVSEVVNGLKPGRENDRERIIAYNVGISLHDIYFASKIYHLCEAKEVDIVFGPPNTKFWV